MSIQTRYDNPTDIADIILFHFLAISSFSYFITHHLSAVSPSLYYKINDIFPSLIKGFPEYFYYSIFVAFIANISFNTYLIRKETRAAVIVKLGIALTVFVIIYKYIIMN